MDYINGSRLSDYQGVASGMAGSLSGMANVAKPPQQDTLFSLIEQLEKQAFTARENAQAVADAVDGQPVEKNPGGINPSPVSAVEKLRMILYTLQAVNGEANRARRALGI